MTAGILHGMRVVEASAFIAAPSAGMALAQMGADVIRIDPLQGGLDYRRWPVTEDDTSLIWCGLNRSKRSVALDLASPQGREIAMAIACAPGENAGLLVTNLPPRGWLDHDALKARRPDLIQFTLQGDRHGRSAVDYTVNAEVGMPYVTGPADDDAPVNHVLPAWDLITGQTIAMGLLAAERHRRLTGEGQHVQLALQDVALATVTQLGFIEEARRGRPRERHGNELFGAFGRDFPCADGRRVMIVGLTAKQWQSICKAMDLTQAMAQLGAMLGRDLSREGERFRARREIAALVAPWIAARPFAEVADVFERHGLCWGAYRSVAELAESPELRENPVFTELEQPGVGPMIAASNPIRFGAMAETRAAPAPVLGQHTQEVLSQVLGMSAGEYGRLRDAGIAGPAA